MPDLIRHPETNEDTGFWLEFIPMEIGAGMTTFCKNHTLWADANELYPSAARGAYRVKAVFCAENRCISVPPRGDKIGHRRS
jgi:hypothetical protein